jgi:hypothetical protein
MLGYLLLNKNFRIDQIASLSQVIHSNFAFPKLKFLMIFPSKLELVLYTQNHKEREKVKLKSLDSDQITYYLLLLVICH